MIKAVLEPTSYPEVEVGSGDYSNYTDQIAEDPVESIKHTKKENQTMSTSEGITSTTLQTTTSKLSMTTTDATKVNTSTIRTTQGTEENQNKSTTSKIIISTNIDPLTTEPIGTSTTSIQSVTQQTNTVSLEPEAYSSPDYLPYQQDFCKSFDNPDICLALFKNLWFQNIESLIMQLRVHNITISGNDLFNTLKSGVSLEVSTGKSYCAKILPDETQFPINSGLGNGVEILVDLETFNNGDLDRIEDGLDILIADKADYSLASLRGFSVGPGSAVEIVARPLLYTITQAALDNFDYVDRKCIDINTDPGLDSLNGVTGNYSLGNCLVSATITEIQKR